MPALKAAGHSRKGCAGAAERATLALQKGLRWHCRKGCAGTAERAALLPALYCHSGRCLAGVAFSV